MHTLFQNLKLEKQKEILILNQPDGFAEELAALVDIEIYESLIQVNKTEFALIFVTTIEELESQLQTLLPKLKEDAILWIAHPRKKSLSLFTDITDLYHWKPLINNCYDEAGRIKVNADWEAIRFRKLEYMHCEQTEDKQRS